MLPLPLHPRIDLFQHARRLNASYRHWTHQVLLEAGTEEDLVLSLWRAPFVLVSHGVEPDPILNYGNCKALELWEMTWEELTRTPSRLTAETPNRAERARLLKEVTEKGYIKNYSGVRISKSGKRFRIEQATVWNLLDENGDYAGQAAMFDQWNFLEG